MMTLAADTRSDAGQSMDSGALSSGGASAHVPVMLAEVLSYLPQRDRGIYVDGTFGRGGYTAALLDRAGDSTVYAIDRDETAIGAGQGMVDRYGARLTLRHGLFGDMARDLSSVAGMVHGVILDLGVSSPQLDLAERGFSFRFDGPLHMGMGLNAVTAETIVNTWPEEEIAHILYHYGEERLSRRIARRIVAVRAEKAIQTTGDLADLVRSVVPRTPGGIDPATRTFQGIRMAVNDELGELNRALEGALTLLAPGGRLVVVTFHSLEDRCVKLFLRAHGAPAPAPSRYRPAPLLDAQPPSLEIITRKAVTPSSAECKRNPRARSAKLRVGEKR